MDIVRTLAACVLFAVVVLAQENSTRRTGKLGHSVKLPCQLSVSKPARVWWRDTVHTSSPDPILIFQSPNNPNFTINSLHPNSADYTVDRNNFDLKISKLTFDDVGTYSCISETEPTVFRRQDHYLSIYGSLKCSGETQLLDGDKTTLKCAVNYTGEQPSITWFHDDHLLKSVGRFDLLDSPMAAKDLEVNATHDLDGGTFRCQSQLPDRNDECSLLLNVMYPVRDIGFKSDNRNNFYAGEEVTCTAKGNPAPEISLVPTSLPERVDSRKKSSIIIPNSWVGTELNLECTAKNTYLGEEKVIRKTMSLRVLAKATPKPAASGSESIGRGLTDWKGFPLILLSVTLMKLLVFCC